MASERPPPEYRTARIASALLLIVLVVAVWLLDAFRTDFEVNPAVLLLILALVAGLLGVDIPFFKDRK